MAINVAWARIQLAEFLRLSETHLPAHEPGAMTVSRLRNRGTQPEAIASAQRVEWILDRVLPEWRSSIPLFQSVFYNDDPKPGQPRLRLMVDDGSDTFRSVHRGAMAFAEARYAGIRNPKSHEDGLPELLEHEALDQLAAFSALAPWVDGATVSA
ncbi:TIGR02391 family protein [Streptomyces sp. NPDC048383]|uniref:TIGR02391 family protein n=1 Tax=Streptomyces sp. NPDC048383 TaxID=3155386 RepID=UPI00343A5890